MKRISNDAATLARLIGGLKDAGRLPKNFEFSRLGFVHMATAFDEVKSHIITESVTVGMDQNPDTAALKAVVELIERRAFKEGAQAGVPACQTERSDGFAAYPVQAGAERSIARRNAYNEALERFTWATWWDSCSINHSKRTIDLESSSAQILRDIRSLVSLRECIEVTPTISNSTEQLVAYFAFLEPFGVISGGAAGSGEDKAAVIFRACCELARHALAIHKVRANGLVPKTFYEKRLTFFGLTQEGEQLVRSRIDASGQAAIELPKLLFDTEIPHTFSPLVYVHRCLFENQPPFVGGDLKRLCL